MNFIISASTDAGLVKNVNQDSFTLKKANTSVGETVFAVMCDGMGGFSNGEIASATLVKRFSDWFIDDFSKYDWKNFSELQIKSEWNRILESTNSSIGTYGEINNIKLGTTVTAVLFIDGKFYCVNVGDSRAYLFKNNSVCQLTKDHTLVQREIDLGHISYDEALIHPQRNVLIQCIGCCKNLNPDYYFGDYELQDVFLLCSDGFRHEISEKEISEHINMCNTSSELKEKIEFLINQNKDRGETDNITAIVIKVV